MLHCPICIEINIFSLTICCSHIAKSCFLEIYEAVVDVNCPTNALFLSLAHSLEKTEQIVPKLVILAFFVFRQVVNS